MNEQTLTVPQFIAAFKLGRTRVYEEIDSGRLVTYKVGRNRYISSRAALDWQQRLESETSNQETVGAA
jgi:hypothetical protein